MYPGTHAKLRPEKAAVIVAETGEAVSYAMLDQRSIQLAHVLRDAGLRPGDHVALLSLNSPRMFEVYWAALRSGLFITAVNHHLNEHEIAYIVDDCGATALVVSADLKDLAEAVLPLTQAVRLRLAFGGPVAGHGVYEDAVAAASTVPPLDQPRGADMLYSSGTTGRPKGISMTLPERQVHEPGDWMLEAFGSRYGFDESAVYYSAAPLYHAAPLRFCGLVHSVGGTVVLSLGFDAETSLAMIEKYRATHSQWVPTMFVRMLKLTQDVRESYDVSSMRYAVHAAAPCPVEVKSLMLDWWGPVLYEYYAATEAVGITFIGPQEWADRPGSVGKAGLGIVHVCDDDGVELPSGSTGSIYFERDTVSFEYHRDPQKTREAQHPDHPNWATTGDIGHLDADEYLYLTDRKSFMIISGGVNIYPQEIEDCLTIHPKVYDVAVVGVPHPDLGEQVTAFVQAADGETARDALKDELLSFAGQHLARFKVPRDVEFVSQLPRTATGKLMKHLLKKPVA